ncbi:MAG: hypothetical protein ACLRRK_04995 [Parasutterella sp.]
MDEGKQAPNPTPSAKELPKETKKSFKPKVTENEAGISALRFLRLFQLKLVN